MSKYSFEFKLAMVESYLSNEVSYEELALANGISNYSTIARWVCDFRVAGPDALRPRKKGRKKTLDKPKIDDKQQGFWLSTDAGRIKKPRILRKQKESTTYNAEAWPAGYVIY